MVLPLRVKRTGMMKRCSIDGATPTVPKEQIRAQAWEEITALTRSRPLTAEGRYRLNYLADLVLRLDHGAST